MTHMALVGLMGAGKTTVGRRLAARRAVRFVDTDAAIEAATGRTVRELWAEGGEAAYRGRERAAVLDALASPDPIVLAVPGGVAVDPEMAAAVAGTGVVAVYLRARPETLAARLGAGPDHRPLLGDDPASALAALFTARDATYRDLATHTLDVDTLDPPTAAATVDRLVG
jgi:shikimate kinase